MDEKNIIKQILKGDTEKYKLLLDRYQPGLVRHCFIMVHDYFVANDITQDASVKAYFQLRKYDDRYHFSTWLYKIATNLCLDYLKKHKSISLDNIPEPMSNTPYPLEQLEKNEMAKKLHEAVLGLPIKYQTVISLYYWEGYSYEEISKIMTIPVGTVRTWLKRGKEQLKEVLNGQV